MMPKIFISYKRSDKDKVFPLVAKIEKELGCKCWVDLDGIESSVQFASVICHAIDNADVILFMHSSIHLTIDFDTDWTIKELNYAQVKKKRVVLVKLDDACLDNIFLLEYGSKNNIDSTDPVQFNKLLNDLKSWLHIPSDITAKPLQGDSLTANLYARTESSCPCGSGKPFNDCHGKETVAQIQSERIWQIGDYYNVNGKEGVVFWVDETGRHGKIVSMVQAQRQWCTDNVFNQEKLAGSKFVDSETMFVDCQFSYFNGSANTDLIRAKYKWWSDYPAVAWCTELGEGWYLPARDELLQLLSDDSVYATINATLYKKQSQALLRKGSAERYWSSTIGVKYNIRPYVYFMADGGCYLKDGIFNCYVRAVSAF